MHFIVAEWNKPSIEFYKRRGASDLSDEEGWRLYAIEKDDLVKISTKKRWSQQMITDGKAFSIVNLKKKCVSLNTKTVFVKVLHAGLVIYLGFL